MKMQFAPIFFVNVLLFIQFVCLCNGAPPKKDGQSSSSPRLTKRITNKEREFIINALLSLPNDFFEASDITVWQYIANKMQEQRRLGTEGFPKDRDARTIREYFKKTLACDANVMATLPVTVSQKLNNPQHVQHYGGKQPDHFRRISLSENGKLAYYLDRYTYEEDKLIVDTLSSPQYTRLPIQANEVWKEIAQQFYLKRKEGWPGFYADRTFYGLRLHFLRTLLSNPNGRVKVPEDLIRKYLLTGYKKGRRGAGGSSSQHPSQSQQTNLQFDLDFSNLDEPSLSNPDNLGSDLEYLEDYEDFWDFTDFEE